jgi:hypothetical protein
MNLDRLQKGKAPTLLNTEKGNELIDKVNALSSMKVVRGSSDKFDVSSSNSVLTLQEMPEGIGEEIELWVCVDNVPKKLTFYVKDLVGTSS